jgi:hypothetical protein
MKYDEWVIKPPKDADDAEGADGDEASTGAGDRDRTGDIQLGKLTFCH